MVSLANLYFPLFYFHFLFSLLGHIRYILRLGLTLTFQDFSVQKCSYILNYFLHFDFGFVLKILYFVIFFVISITNQTNTHLLLLLLLLFL